MQQAVHTAQVDEGAIVHQILHPAHQDCALAEPVQQLAPAPVEFFFHHHLPAHHHVASLPVQLGDLAGNLLAHEGVQIAQRPHVRLGGGQKSADSAHVNLESPFGARQHAARDARLVVEGPVDLFPGSDAGRPLIGRGDRAFLFVIALDQNVNTVPGLDAHGPFH